MVDEVIIRKGNEAMKELALLSAICFLCMAVLSLTSAYIFLSALGPFPYEFNSSLTLWERQHGLYTAALLSGIGALFCFGYFMYLRQKCRCAV